MENICKDQVEKIVEFELSGELVEGAIKTSKGCAEKVDIPAADHQLPCGGELIHCKHGARNVAWARHKTLQCGSLSVTAPSKQAMPWSTKLQQI